MNNLFVARIHNNRLGSCVPVSSIDEGIELINTYVVDQFHRELTTEEMEILENDMEFYNDDDADNIVSFTIGSLE